jgi:TolB protein
MGFMHKTVHQLARGILLLALFALAGCAEQPPASESILYHIQSAENSAETSIWQTGADGSNPTQLVDFGWFADYSPDNARIAFGEFYSAGIWVVETGKKNPTRLTDFGSSPDWSPDGKMIAFNSGGTAGAERFIWVMNVDGGGARQISSVNGSFPDWSPDGTQILFHGEVNNGIWRINPDGSGETQLLLLGAYPAWSPDGKMIAYQSLEDYCIWVMNADGTGARKINDHSGSQPAWSADGTRIAYKSAWRDMDGKLAGEGIWVVNLDGSGNRMIVKNGRNPDWSN